MLIGSRELLCDVHPASVLRMILDLAYLYALADLGGGARPARAPPKGPNLSF